MKLPAGVRSSAIKSLPRWAIFALGMYAGAALLTLGFQTYVRLEQCSGYRACTISVVKGAVWSTIWPASWPVFVSGLKRRTATGDHPAQHPWWTVTGQVYGVLIPEGKSSGWMVPDIYRDRVEIETGDAKLLLFGLIDRLDRLDLFSTTPITLTTT
jgi:hypothetical protein